MTDHTLDIITHLRANRNPEKAAGMKAYMKHQFEFLGLQKAARAALTNAFMKEKCKNEIIDWKFVDTLWDQPEREFQYLALNYLSRMQKQFEKKDIKKLEQLIISKSWWDTVDGIAPLVGFLTMMYTELKKSVIKRWIYDDDIWLNRISIIFQLKYKQDTDIAFLVKAILANAGTKEFFLNKAIGWALREYSK
ncbi:MAG: DNA alkylation repair protein, partial [Candidatus Marinimicrobia bacterium]|nr:DNA alkylation repair protein [Candidatus Neomarinimicrobiota bacterium]